MVTLTTEQKATLIAQPITEAGNPSTLAAPPVWESSNPSIVSVTQDVADTSGLTAVVVAVGVGSAIVTVKGNADLQGGNREISGSIDSNVILAEAVTINVVAGEPELQ